MNPTNTERRTDGCCGSMPADGQDPSAAEQAPACNCQDCPCEPGQCPDCD